jgi:serine-type D-Ala-D-Ala carboxypeptidase/endopeptidase (penicillin-binding protein 4)
VKSSVGYRRRSRRHWRIHKRRVVAATVVLALLIVGVWVLARPHGSAVEPARIANLPAIPLRAAPPAPRWSGSDLAKAGVTLDRAFVPAIAGAQGWSLAVVTVAGEPVYGRRADIAVAPASTQKLVVAATSLWALGPAYRFHTMFAARQGIGDDGTLDGDLWLVGSGDPSLWSADLRNGVAMLARSGLRRIGGGVVVDATALSGPERNPHWDRDDDGQDYAAPISAVSVDGDTIESHIRVAGVDRAVWTPMQDVARYVATSTQHMLALRGITASTPPSVGAAPLSTVVLWDHRSAPLARLESHMLWVSDNHYAEQLLRTVGEEVTGTPDDAGGIAAERAFLMQQGIPAPGLRLVDGSGLSAQNRVAAITLARLLASSEASLYMLLPRGGREGTLEDYGFTSALGRVRAKSGHLSGVSSLAGYVTTRRHGRVAFAFLIDGSPADPDAAIVAAIDRLSTF